MVQTIVRNLLSNALKFTPEQGKIEIQIIEQNNTVITKVGDTGIGIDEKTLKKRL